MGGREREEERAEVGERPTGPQGPCASTNNVWKGRRPRRCCLAAEKEVSFPRPCRVPQDERASRSRQEIITKLWFSRKAFIIIY